jgi:exopolyphosphatase
MEDKTAAAKLLAFLAGTRAAVADGRVRRLVLGNEAADLDSMAAAVGYAYALSAARSDESAFVPVINIPRADYKLRTEAAYLFAEAGIPVESLTFADELDLGRLAGADGTEIVLVDHNVLAAGQQELACAVVGVIDHHKDEGGFADARVRVIEPVGSACTLVAAALLGDAGALVEPGLAKLLAGTILLDTVNLDPAAQRATPKDGAIVTRLLEICGADRNALFERLQFEKFNVASLDTADLLRKDYKEYRLGAVRCGIASVLLPIARWQEKDPELTASLAEFAAQRGLDALLAMNAFTDPEFRRELVVWAADEALHARLTGFLENSDLGLEQLPGGGAPVAFYSQGNAAYSRKKLQPLLLTLFN